MFKIVLFVIEKLNDIHTSHHIVLALPFNTLRSAQLRLTFAYTVLSSCIDVNFCSKQIEEAMLDTGIQVRNSFSNYFDRSIAH